MVIMNKLLSIVGPTATGKSDLAVFLAEAFGGEVVSADSRQVYRGLDIGSGKISKEEMRGIPHHLLDVSDVRDEYTVSHYKKDSSAIIETIHRKQELPVLCGGSGFWVDTVSRGLQIPNVPPNFQLRTELSTKTPQELFVILTSLDSRRASEIDQNNPYRLIRAIEIATALGQVPPKVFSSPYDLFTVGITDTKDVLDARIAKRLDARIDAGMIDEVRNLLIDGVAPERLIALGLEYRHITLFLTQQYETVETMRSTLLSDIVHFAKRQMTWFKRHEDIHWIRPGEWENAKKLVTSWYYKD
jgi:tRNA dimethylallyltransferase